MLTTPLPTTGVSRSEANGRDGVKPYPLTKPKT